MADRIRSLRREWIEAMGRSTNRGSAMRALDFLIDAEGVHECRRAFRWWTERHYDAICDANGELRLSFHDGEQRRSRDDGWSPGPPAGKLRTIRSLLSRRVIAPRSEVPFDGEVIERMRHIGPGAFQELRRTSTRPRES